MPVIIWGNVHMLGCYTLLRTRPVLPGKPGLSLELLKQQLLVFANNIINYTNAALNTIMGMIRVILYGEQFRGAESKYYSYQYVLN